MFEPADFLEESLRLGFPRADRCGDGFSPGPASSGGQAARPGHREEWLRRSPRRLFIDARCTARRPRPTALDLVAAARTASRTRGSPPRTTPLADLCSPGVLARRPVRVRPRAKAHQAPGRRARTSPCPARHQVGVVGAPDGGAIALLFVRRLQVPVVMTTSTRRGLTRASATCTQIASRRPRPDLA